jgi:hypothetical protein
MPEKYTTPMPVKLIAEEVHRFLESSEPEVMCIMGKWGVGKTFAWNQYLRTSALENTVSLKRYSYVSLFGQNSLEELKYAIFENTVGIDQIVVEPNFDTFGGVISYWRTWRRATKLIGFLPKVKDYSSFLTRSFFLAVRNQVICIDDLERVGDGLSTKDILGLISFLKEQRRCKIVLLLNDEELNDKAAEEFKAQLEKVIDVEMRFKPTATEATEIGVDKSTSFNEKLAQNCIALGIVNIRVIRKIQRLLRRLEELLALHDRRVFESAIPSIVLFGWAVYQPKLAPSLDFIKGFNRFSHLLEKNKTESEDEKGWRLIMGGINFTNFDEFDDMLLQSVQRGYFDSDVLEKAAEDFDKKLQHQDKDSSFQLAWSKYHDSFLKNDSEVLDEMFSAFKKAVQVVSPQNLDGTLWLFREMGRDKQADEMIDYYMAQRQEKRDFYDPSRSVFLELKDPKLLKAFKDKLASFEDTRNPKDILINIAKHSGWNPEDISALAKLSSDDFYKLFKENIGDDMRIIVSQALKFARYGQSDPQMNTITANAEAALRIIATESPMNRQRVLSYGVTLEEE